jgi:hypothetical protein
MSDTEPQIGMKAFLGCLIAVTAFVGLMASLDLAQRGFDSDVLSWAVFAWAIGCIIAVFTALPLGCLIGWLFHKGGMVTRLTAAITGMLTGFILTGAVTFGTWTSDTVLIVCGFSLLGFVSGWMAHGITAGRSVKPRAA